MDTQVDIPEHDMIDEELLTLIHALVGEDADEEEMDAASNLLFSLVEDMVEGGEIEEIPETDAEEDSKKAWLEKCLPVLREAFDSVLKDLASEDFMDHAESEALLKAIGEE